MHFVQIIKCIYLSMIGTYSFNSFDPPDKYNILIDCFGTLDLLKIEPDIYCVSVCG